MSTITFQSDSLPRSGRFVNPKHKPHGRANIGESDREVITAHKAIVKAADTVRVAGAPISLAQNALIEIISDGGAVLWKFGVGCALNAQGAFFTHYFYHHGTVGAKSGGRIEQGLCFAEVDIGLHRVLDLNYAL